ncbi:YafY family protein [Roseibium sp. HPY-6]|uniref:helix-turn-helix transcriptional regulator n=1 Tax=Roseibium sp. HPY-6 TaxID=3229852 RepID=UPI00338EAA34
MRRADRLFELIEILRRAKNPIAASTIASELEVCKRTVYRDIATLVSRRVPIRGEAGVGYILEAGFHMPPLMLTTNEIEAAILGAQWVQTRAEPELQDAATSLLTKIETILPREFESLFLAPATSVAPADLPPEVLSSAEIRAAVRQRKKLRIRYEDNNGTLSERTIWPILLGYRDHGRIIAAWCELREDFRYFRTERIIEAEPLEETIPRRQDQLRADWKHAMDAERERYEDPADETD